MSDLINNAAQVGFMYTGDNAYQVPENATHITFHWSVVEIEPQAFFVHQQLTQIDLPDGLAIIGSRAFFMCEAVKKITLPSTVRVIRAGAFAGCRCLQSVELGDGLQVIGAAAFASNEVLTHLRIPPRVRIIENRTFSNCTSLFSIELPEKLERIDIQAFNNCKQLRNVLIPKSTSVYKEAFHGCSRLEELLSGDKNQFINTLQTRFDDFPIHKLCYYQGYYTTQETLRDFKQIISKESDESLSSLSRDSFRMTALHVLALSARPNIHLCKALVATYTESDLNMRDRWDRDPLMYCSMHLTQDSTKMTRCVIDSLLSGRYNSLGLDRWRNDISNEIENLPVSSHRQERITQMGEILTKLFRYLTKERLSLVELAVWKFKIDDLSEGRSDTSWIGRDQCRLICGAEIIISHVLPFLEHKVAVDRS
jgi:hypothetical protein